MSPRDVPDSVQRFKQALLKGINERLDQFGWTQATMVHELGVSQATASYLRRGAWFKVSSDVLVEIGMKLGVRAWVQTSTAPSWVDSAVRGGLGTISDSDFREYVEWPADPSDSGGYSYPGKSATELVRLVVGALGWGIYRGALFTRSKDLIVTSLETAAAAMSDLKWILVDSGEVDLNRVRGLEALAVELLQKQVGQLTGIEVGISSGSVEYIPVMDSVSGEILVKRGGGLLDVEISLLDGEFEASCTSCAASIPVKIEPGEEPVFSEFHFECGHCWNCVIYDTDPRVFAPGDPDMGTPYCEGTSEDDPGCEMEAGFRAAMAKD